MKINMKIFDIKKLLRIAVMVAVCGMTAGAYAYIDEDDEDDCQYFSPAYALCTIHAYNAGMATNPTDSSEISEMNEIIAMKSTLIAQQMKQQYDALNAMVKRFKTQLEKAVLTSKMEVLTGNTSASSGGSSSSDNNGLANAEDCDALDKANIYDCLLRNLGKIEKAAEKDLSNARKQLNNDIDIASGYGMYDDNAKDKCSNIGNKTGVQNCVKAFRRSINNTKSNYEDSRSRNRGSWGG